MLKVDQLNADEYLRYVAMGPSSVSNKSEWTSAHVFIHVLNLLGVGCKLMNSKERYLPDTRDRYPIQRQGQGRHAHTPT
jgi:hypothetical protein